MFDPGAELHVAEHHGALHGQVVRTHRARRRLHGPDGHRDGPRQLARALRAGDDHGRHPAHASPVFGVARAVGVE
ncbi:xanthine dehydrogenase [Burkholderia gladioli]|nr:xanthine dehydrogenase [Burkholderia gladioli]